VARATVGRLKRHHLFALVKPAKPVNTPRVRPALRMMLDVLGSLPAVLLGPRLEVVAINRMGKILLDDLDRVPAFRVRAAVAGWPASSPGRLPITSLTLWTCSSSGS